MSPASIHGPRSTVPSYQHIRTATDTPSRSSSTGFHTPVQKHRPGSMNDLRDPGYRYLNIRPVRYGDAQNLMDDL